MLRENAAIFGCENLGMGMVRNALLNSLNFDVRENRCFGNSMG